jgi:hypothetical protein
MAWETETAGASVRRTRSQVRLSPIGRERVMKRIVCFLVGMGWLAPAVVMAAPVGVCATVATPTEASTTGTRTTIDPATKLPIRVERPSRDVLIVTVADGKTTVRKEFRAGAATTVVRNGNRQVTIGMRGGEIVVTDARGAKRGIVSKPEGLAGVVSALGASTVVRAGSDLLDRLALQADTVEGNALLLTRALLGASHGDKSGAVEHQRWIRWRTSQPRLVRDSDGPAECWDKYAAEAIRIMNDYMDCVSGCKWYNLFCNEGCEAIYVMRAEMAFLWYFNCNGPFYRE